MFQLTPAPTSTPTSSTTTTNSTATATSSSSSPASRTGRRRGLSYLRSYTQHRLSTLAGSHDSSPPVASSNNNPDILHPAANTPPSPTAESRTLNPSQTTRCTDPPDEPLLPPNPLSPSGTSPHLTYAVPADCATTSVVNTAIGGISRIMGRNRPTPSTLRRSISENTTTTMAALPNGSSHELPSIRLVPHQDPRANRPSLTFPPMSRTLPSEDSIIRVGRYSERDATPNPPPNVPSAAPVGFKSKVVSRKHCEFWCHNNQWYIKDVKSSSGTFLNHIRLSQPSVESRPFPVKDGDVVQLGIDFRGGEEMIFRCVKIRVECNRGWQKALNSFKSDLTPCPQSHPMLTGL
ncbi:MAG: hypothetical protein Q9223_001211 [Gallowayella weberi]